MPDLTNPSNPIIEDVNKSTESYIFKNDKMLTLGYVILVVACVAAIIYFHLDIRFILIPVMAGLAGYGHIKTKIKREFTQQFGSSIGFTYTPKAELVTVNGKLFKLGYGQHIYDVLSGTLDGRNSRIFSYCFTQGSGKSSHTYYFTVFETAFANVMPDIVLTSRSGFFGNNFNLFDSSEHVQLEGDFNTYFSLRVPKGYETEAYQIFPPNVMADLIDRAKNLNFEFNGNKLYIYASGLVTVRERLQAMFDLAKYLDELFARSARAVDVTADVTTPASTDR